MKETNGTVLVELTPEEVSIVAPALDEVAGLRRALAAAEATLARILSMRYLPFASDPSITFDQTKMAFVKQCEESVQDTSGEV